MTKLNRLTIKIIAMNKKIIFFIILMILWPISLCAYGQDGGKIRFAVMGCAHFGACGAEKLELAIEKIKEERPDFVLFSGGMIDPAMDISPELLWKEFDNIVSKLGVPVYDVLNNCRLSELPISKEKVDLMEKCFLDRYKNRYYAFKYKNNLFVGLDSTRLRQEKGAIFEKQVNFLKDSIANSKYNNIFIFTGESPWLEGASEWDKLIHPLIDKKVKVVFGGGKHYLFERKKIGDVTYITAGIPECYPQSYSSKPSFPNFLIIEIEKNELSMKIVPIINTVPIENLRIPESTDNMPVKFLNEVVNPPGFSSDGRENLLMPQRVIEALKIGPGMDILDLGAGSGDFTFCFADALKATGRVFATEINPELVEAISNRGKKSGYKNVFPVLVKSEGMDSFYKQHQFDLIFVCTVYPYLRHPEDYFRELKPSLKKGGRLYIIDNKDVFDFTEIEVTDFKDLIKTLALKGEKFPVFQKMDKTIQNFIKTWQGENVPLPVRKRIINNLNRMLLDRWLFYDLLDYFANNGMIAESHLWSSSLYFILPDPNTKIGLVKWLYVNLDADGVFNKNEKPLNFQDKQQLHTLNKILLKGVLNIYNFTDGCPIFVKKESVISTMEKAGYQFVKAYDFLPMHYFLEFKSKK